MSFRKLGIPKDVQNAQKRSDGLKAIDSALDLGNGISVKTLEDTIKEITGEISEYNSMLSQADQKSIELYSLISVKTLEDTIKEITGEISEYNSMLSQADQKSNLIESRLKFLNDLSSRALKGVEFKYGKDSDEYEMAGGKRPSKRKKTVKKTDGEDNKK